MTVVRSPRFAPRARRTSLTIAASGLALLLAACGSQLDPNEVAVAGGGTVGSGGVVVGADGEVISADGGTTGSVDGSTGISNDTITIGNASDISGPVPGLFESAQDAVKAFVAYYNRSNPDGICGRSLALKNYDSRTDASADQRNYVDMCDNVFAAVGSRCALLVRHLLRRPVHGGHPVPERRARLFEENLPRGRAEGRHGLPQRRCGR